MSLLSGYPYEFRENGRAFFPQGGDVRIKGNCKAFLHDVKSAMLVSETNPVGLNSFLMETLSFIAINLHRCWPRE